MYCCGHRYQGLSTELIFFRAPNSYSLQHFSINPLRLDVGFRTETDPDDEIETSVLKPEERRQLSLLMEHACASQDSRKPAWDVAKVVEQVLLFHAVYCGS